MSTQNNKNLVPSKEIAVKLAEIYIGNIYGQEVSIKQKPYIVVLSDGAWVIKGKPPEALGGRFTIIISEVDGRVIQITHSK